MILLLPSPCIQPTIPVNLLTITAEGGVDADDDGGNHTEVLGDDSNNDGQHFNREIGITSPDDSNPGNDGRMFQM